jgi:drug/metabolite transporter (DMT)-like permease
VSHRLLSKPGPGPTWAAFAEYAAAVAVLPPLAPRRAERGRTLGLHRPVPGLPMGCAFILHADGVVLTTVANALPLFHLAPVWATLMELAVLRRRPVASPVVAIALGLGGPWVLTARGGALPSPANLGDRLGLASGVMGAGAVEIRPPAMTRRAP